MTRERAFSVNSRKPGMNAMDVTSYIEQVDLAIPPRSMLLDAEELAPLEDGARQGAVVDSNIVTFPKGTPLEVKNAVGAWLLFAQRAASAKVSDRSNARHGSRRTTRHSR
jgi:hypothetical protein